MLFIFNFQALKTSNFLAHYLPAPIDFRFRNPEKNNLMQLEGTINPKKKKSIRHSFQLTSLIIFSGHDTQAWSARKCVKNRVLKRTTLEDN